MDSICPDCWGYDDSHPCLCRERPDDLGPVDAADPGPAPPELQDA